MKKYIYVLLAILTASAFVSCKEEEGQEPGNDSNPYVFVNECELGDSYDPDCDVAVRFAVNNASTSVYYLAETTSDYESHLESMGESEYADYIKSNGTQLTTVTATGTTGDSVYEATLTSLYGDYTIVAAAFDDDGDSYIGTTAFTGIQWNDVVTGTYRLVNSSGVISVVGGGSRTISTTLQVAATDANSYRFKNLYGQNNHLYFTVVSSGTDSDGVSCKFFSLTSQSTNATFGSYGTLMIRDVATWQGDDSYLEYNNFYEDYSWYAFVSYYVSAGAVAYGYDAFFPD